MFFLPLISLLKKFLPQILVVAALSMFLFTGYVKVKNIGRQEASAEYSLIIANQQKLIDVKIAGIEVLATTLISNNAINSNKLAIDIATIVKNTKGKSLTVVKEGVCTPSQTFTSSFAEINKRTNQTIKESQK